MSTTTIIVIAVVFVGDLVIFGFLWLAAAKSRANQPPNVGNGRIEEGSGKPNFVSSVGDQPEVNRIEPLVFTGDPEEAWTVAVESFESLDRIKITSSTGSYLHAEATSSMFKFVDDIELQLVAEEKKIHVKSGSRVGHSDFGANRARVEKIRAEFAKRLSE